MSRLIVDRFPFYYGWVIVGTSFIIMIVAYGVWWSFPVFYVAILDEFGWTRAETASVFTVGSVVYGLGSLAAGIFVDRFGPRKLLPVAGLILATGCFIGSISNQIWHLFIAYGAFIGFGTIAAGFIPNAVAVSNWFARRRGTALGIALVGDGAAPLLAVLTQHLIANFGWRNSYLILAMITAVTVVPLASIFMRTRPQDLGLEPDGVSRTEESKERIRSTRVTHTIQVINKEWAGTDWTFFKGVKTYQFWLLLGIMATLGTSMGIVWTHQVALTIDIGYSVTLAAFIFGLTGIMGAVGRLGGFLADRLGREITFTIASVLAVFGALALLTVTNYNQIWILYLYAITFGLGLGFTAPTYSSSAADLFSGSGFGSILGFVNIGWGVGNGVGAWIGGAIFDQTGSYILAIIAAIVCLILMCLFLWLAAPRKVRRVVRVS